MKNSKIKFVSMAFALCFAVFTAFAFSNNEAVEADALGDVIGWTDAFGAPCSVSVLCNNLVPTTTCLDSNNQVAHPYIIGTSNPRECHSTTLYQRIP